MKLSNRIRAIAIGIFVCALTACHSMHKNGYDQSAIDEANAAASNAGAQSSGLGDDGSNFGDQAGSEAGHAIANKRIYYFDFDSNVVHDSDKPAIDANAAYLLSHTKTKIMLEGHTDPRGSREYNIGLGERRAKAVAEILTAKGVSPAQIRIVSYGAEKLAVPGRTEADYQLDRRVVLVYLR